MLDLNEFSLKKTCEFLTRFLIFLVENKLKLFFFNLFVVNQR